MKLTDIRRWFAGFLMVVAGFGLTSMALADETSGKVYLAGCVHKAGAIDLPAGQPLNVLQVIALDGGPTGYADMQHVNLVRMGPNGTHETVVFDILHHDPLLKRIAVQAGDIIVIPAR